MRRLDHRRPVSPIGGIWRMRGNPRDASSYFCLFPARYPAHHVNPLTGDAVDNFAISV
jgi:hypothetical protein